MIYIPFFIVILIDKRDDKRDGKREQKREYIYEYIPPRESERAKTKKGKQPLPEHTTQHPAHPASDHPAKKR